MGPVQVLGYWLQWISSDMRWCWFVLMALLLGSAQASADPEPDPELRKTNESIDIPIAPRSAEWLIDKRDEWSKDISSLAVNIDRFFAGDEALDRNESYVRLRAGSIWRRNGDISSDSDIKVKLDLPGSKRRWKLLFESDPDEFSDLETQTRSTPTDNRQFTDTEGSTGALRFVVDEKSKWKKDFDIGVRGSTPLDTFARYQLRRNHKINEDWSLYFKESIYIFHSDGWGQKTSFSFERLLTKDYLWRNRIEAKFKDEENVLQTAFVMSTLHVLDDSRAIDYAVGVLVNNRPVSQTTAYFINTTFRKRLYKDWLFFDIRPELAFRRSYDEDTPGRVRKHGFKADPSLTIGFDAYLWE
jgi:hypothetical protein